MGHVRHDPRRWAHAVSHQGATLAARPQNRSKSKILLNIARQVAARMRFATMELWRSDTGQPV